MNALLSEEKVELEVENLGPISKANLDLRPLTVFIGPSNTGKSYLAILIYALHRHFSGGPWLYPWHIGWMRNTVRDRRRKNLSQEMEELLIDFVNSLSNSRNRSRDRGDIVLPHQLIQVFNTDLEDQIGALDEEISRCFGISNVSMLIHKGSRKGAQIGFRRMFPNLIDSFEHKMWIKDQENRANVTIPEALSVKLDQGMIQHLKQIASELTASVGSVTYFV